MGIVNSSGKSVSMKRTASGTSDSVKPTETLGRQTHRSTTQVKADRPKDRAARQAAAKAAGKSNKPESNPKRTSKANDDMVAALLKLPENDIADTANNRKLLDEELHPADPYGRGIKATGKNPSILFDNTFSGGLQRLETGDGDGLVRLPSGPGDALAGGVKGDARYMSYLAPGALGVRGARAAWRNREAIPGRLAGSSPYANGIASAYPIAKEVAPEIGDYLKEQAGQFWKGIA